MRIIPRLALAAIFALPLFAQADMPPVRQDLSASASGTYELDPSHANVIWRISHLGLSYVTGRFDAISGTLELNAKTPAQSKLNVEVNPASISTHVSALDATLVKEKFFDTAKYPHASFVSKTITVTGKQTGTILGDLTLHGVTKPVMLEARLIGAGKNYEGQDTVGFHATTKLKRSDFGISGFIPAVGDEVELTIDAEFIHKDSGK